MHKATNGNRKNDWQFYLPHCWKPYHLLNKNNQQGYLWKCFGETEGMQRKAAPYLPEIFIMAADQKHLDFEATLSLKLFKNAFQNFFGNCMQKTLFPNPISKNIWGPFFGTAGGRPSGNYSQRLLQNLFGISVKNCFPLLAHPVWKDCWESRWSIFWEPCVFRLSFPCQERSSKARSSKV